MKTLKSISLFFLLSAIFFLHANAQIVYTDVNPDTTINAGLNTPHYYNLDFNNDGITDLNFSVLVHLCSMQAAQKTIACTPTNNSSIADSIFANGVGYPRALNSNTIIGNTLLTWKNNSNQTLKYLRPCQPNGGSAGLFPEAIDKFLAIKFTSGSNIYYGWVRLSLSTTGSYNKITIRDYAYNSIPNQPILAGETSCTTPTVNLTQSGSLSFCAGDSVTLTANGTGYQYQWKKGGVNISGATSKTYVVKTAGVYKCKVTNSCGSKTSGTRTITINCRVIDKNKNEAINKFDDPLSPLTTPHCYCNLQGWGCSGNMACIGFCRPTCCWAGFGITANGPVTFCTNDSVILTCSPASTYQWIKDAVDITGATSQTYVAKTAGSYKCRASKTAQYCGTVTSAIIIVNAEQTPTVTISASGPLSFCNGDSVILTANTLAAQFQWKKGGVNISGATKQTYTAKTAGVYKCKVTNSCGSKTSGTRTVSVNCRMSNENVAVELEHLLVYPNPATNSVTIKFPSDEAGEIQIVNLFGQVVFAEKINAEQTQIDVSKFSAGMYVVKWSSGENNETKTFSIIK